MNEGTGEIQKPKIGSKIRAALLLSFLIAGIGGLLWLIVPREPSYHDQPLSFWLSLAEDNGARYDQKDPKVIESRQAIRNIGSNAIPTLIRILRAKDSSLRSAAMDLAERQDYIKVPLRSAEEQKRKARIGFDLLGEIASNAVPALIDICRHPSSPFSKDIAEHTLMRLYPAKAVAIPHWVVAEKRAQWYMDAGIVQSEAGISSNALRAFSDAIQLEPTNAEAYFSRGDTRLQLEDFTAARADFEQAIALSPPYERAVYGLGLCKFRLKDFRGAETDFTRALDLESNNWSTFNARGLARANLRDLDAALSDFNKAIEISSYDGRPYRNRAMVEMLQTEYELALADASKSIELDKEDAVAWATRGRIQCALKNYRAALADANKSLQLNPNDSNTYASRATAQLCLNEFTSAILDLETAVRLNPKNATAFAARGILKAKRGGEDDAALADLEQAVQLAPQNPQTHGLLGLFQYTVSRWEPALVNCRKALELGAISSVSSYNSYIWLIRAQSGEVEAANKELEAYLKTLDEAKTNEWSAICARFLSGSLPERNFLSQATTAAKRPSAVTDQVCESLFYAAMKRKLTGDKRGALELLQKCRDTKDDNDMAYVNAGVELRALKAR